MLKLKFFMVFKAKWPQMGTILMRLSKSCLENSGHLTTVQSHNNHNLSTDQVLCLKQERHIKANGKLFHSRIKGTEI